MKHFSQKSNEISSNNNLNTLMDQFYETDSNYNTQNPLFRNESIR
jgi:hypothetical protein